MDTELSGQKFDEQHDIYMASTLSPPDIYKGETW